MGFNENPKSQNCQNQSDAREIIRDSKRETLSQVFSSEFCEISKNILF